MGTRSTILVVLAVAATVISPPIGIWFLIAASIHYLHSYSKDSKSKDNTVVVEQQDPAEQPDPTEQLDPNPDFNNLFNDSDFIREQENLR